MKVNYWFKAHKSGYGWHPSSWQGWLVVIVYLAVCVYSFLKIDKQSQSVSDAIFGFLPSFFIFTALLIAITYLKGESIVWGEKDEDQHKIP
jgi:FtsH-binding integral membrane protein